MLFCFGQYALDVTRRELRCGETLVPVEPQVFDLLVYLLRNRERVVTKDELLEGVWNGRIVAESTLTSRINAARKAIGDSGERQGFIRTIARKGFRFAAPVKEQQHQPVLSQSAAETSPPPLSLPVKPSIVVLPFVNLSGDPEQEYFADGITDDIITALCRVRWFFVIAHNSAFAYKRRDADIQRIAAELGVRYVLAGSVRRAGDRVRVTAQLSETPAGNTVWARSYDQAVADLFSVQDEITQTIVGAIEPELSRAERARAKVKAPDSLDAWSIYQHAMSHLYRCSRSDLLEARRLLEDAIALDPNLGAAYTATAEAYYYEVVYGFAESAQANREKAIGPAQHAVSLDPEDASARCTLGRIRYLRREYTAALSELRMALELNPSLALAYYSLGAALVFSGKAAEAFGHLEAAIRLSPYDPNMGSFLVRIADANYFVGKYESAIEFAIKALGQPNFQWSRYAVLIAAAGQLARLVEAQHYLAEVRELRRDFSIDFVRHAHLFGDPGTMDKFCEGLRKAGVPQTA